MSVLWDVGTSIQEDVMLLGHTVHKRHVNTNPRSRKAVNSKPYETDYKNLCKYLRSYPL